MNRGDARGVEAIVGQEKLEAENVAGAEPGVGILQCEKAPAEQPAGHQYDDGDRGNDDEDHA